MSTISLSMHNDIAEIKRVMPRLISFLQANEIGTGGVFRARVAVEELVVNVIRYGYVDNDAHEIDVEVAVDKERIVVTVEDDGRAFDPRQVPRPDLHAAVQSRSAGGWGVHLVRSLSEEIRYHRRGDRNHVEVHIPLAPPPRPGRDRRS